MNVDVGVAQDNRNGNNDAMEITSAFASITITSRHSRPIERVQNVLNLMIDVQILGMTNIENSKAI